MTLEDPQERLRALKEQNHQLSKSRDHYRDLFDFAPIGYLTMNAGLVVREANLAAARLLGVRRSQLIGVSLGEFIAQDQRDDCLRHIRQTLNSNGCETCQLVFERARARNLVVRLESTASTDASDGTAVCRSVLIDVADSLPAERRLQQTHQQLEMAARAAELGVWNLDLTSGEASWNAQLYRLLGLEPREGPEKTERFFEFIHPDDRKGTLQSLKTVLDSTADDIKEDFRIVRPDGKTRWLAARGHIYRNVHGRPVHICGINYDITTRKQTEEAQRLTQFHLASQLLASEQLNEELSQFAYAVSHDLKEPLRAIRNYADFLYEDLADSLEGEQKQYLEGLKTAVDQGDSLIKDLLDFSRVGRLPQQKETVDVPDVVNEIRAMFNLSAEVEITVQPEWPEFHVDRTLFRQILQNLISNGIKFNERTPKRIEIGWQPAANDHIELFVRDNGIGIEPQYRDQVFRIFRRLHTHKEYEGSGVGLATVLKSAQRLGGSVRLESEPGQGSTFYVQLPLKAST